MFNIFLSCQSCSHSTEEAKCPTTQADVGRSKAFDGFKDRVQPRAVQVPGYIFHFKITRGWIQCYCYNYCYLLASSRRRISVHLTSTSLVLPVWKHTNSIKMIKELVKGSGIQKNINLSEKVCAGNDRYSVSLGDTPE